jgi:hypothetical protein
VGANINFGSIVRHPFVITQTDSIEKILDLLGLCNEENVSNMRADVSQLE